MIAIKNAVVPPSCYFCPMTNDGLYLCKANNPYKVLEDDCEERRPDWCPLVPVPPHGDLIDRRYAIATACSGRIRTLPTTEDGENWIRVEEVRESIKNAPTIIPAEEGE